MWVIEVSMEQLWNGREGGTGDPRENPPSSVFVRHDFLIRKSGREPVGRHEGDSSPGTSQLRDQRVTVTLPCSTFKVPISMYAILAFEVQKQRNNKGDIATGFKFAIATTCNDLNCHGHLRKSRSYTQCDKNTASQLRALRLVAIVDSLSRFSASNAGRTSSWVEALRQTDEYSQHRWSIRCLTPPGERWPNRRLPLQQQTTNVQLISCDVNTACQFRALRLGGDGSLDALGSVDLIVLSLKHGKQEVLASHQTAPGSRVGGEKSACDAANLAVSLGGWQPADDGIPSQLTVPVGTSPVVAPLRDSSPNIRPHHSPKHSPPPPPAPAVTINPRENSPTSGIDTYDSHIRKSGSEPGQGLNPVRLVTFAIGSEFIRDTLDDSTPIADLQGNKKRIPYCQMWGNTVATANEQSSDVGWCRKYVISKIALEKNEDDNQVRMELQVRYDDQFGSDREHTRTRGQLPVRAATSRNWSAERPQHRRVSPGARTVRRLRHSCNHSHWLILPLRGSGAGTRDSRRNNEPVSVVFLHTTHTDAFHLSIAQWSGTNQVRFPAGWVISCPPPPPFHSGFTVIGSQSRPNLSIHSLGQSGPLRGLGSAEMKSRVNEKTRRPRFPYAKIQEQPYRESNPVRLGGRRYNIDASFQDCHVQLDSSLTPVDYANREDATANGCRELGRCHTCRVKDRRRRGVRVARDQMPGYSLRSGCYFRMHKQPECKWL
ncbi:hypothetical protein PR048_012140 [Dryococelus australis]|uniref:Beta-lactamase n=1 Tax=Dryococelus australis TaxID=614101 RepID=A0ABQ9HNK9_9NEOP|nr:hypothetical protein PR048_012140 [Dryococelus australis]